MVTANPLRFLPVLLAPVVLAALAFAACGGEEKAAETPSPAETAGPTPVARPGNVDALLIWGAEEIDDFDAMTQPWIEDTGNTLDFTSTRDINAVLTTRVAGGNPPDVAFPASAGIFFDLAREGELTPLSECPGLEETVRAEYPESLIGAGSVDGTLYGVFMKSGDKGTIWYNPKAFTDNGYEPLTADSTFQDLLDLTAQIAADGNVPWSDAEEIGGGSGFPGSDWVQQIVLAESGPDVYDQWVAHTIPYNDPQIKAAWEKFGQIILNPDYVLGGTDRVLATRFSEGSIPLFTDPPEAFMHYLGSFNSGFITDPTLGFPEGLVPGEDFDFMPFPGHAVTFDGNIMLLFNSDPETCSFAEWMASAEAQKIWVARGGFISPNTNISLADYPTDLDRRVAAQMADPDSILRFDADDGMPSGVSGDNGAVFTGILEYIGGGDLDQILQGIEDTFP
jgi:alpha-glucoside transport system substrate-binding protein